MCYGRCHEYPLIKKELVMFMLTISCVDLGQTTKLGGKFNSVDHWNCWNPATHRVWPIIPPPFFLMLMPLNWLWCLFLLKNLLTCYWLNICRFKLKNIEETEAAKKLLQEKRLMGRSKTNSTIPSSYSADYFQRGKDFAEKLKRGIFYLDVHTTNCPSLFVASFY